MAVFRSMNVATLPGTFAELAEYVFSIVAHNLCSPKFCADFDQYPDMNEIDARAKW